MVFEEFSGLAERMREQEREKVQHVLYLDLDGTVRKGYDELGRFVNGPKDVNVFPEAVVQMKRWKEKGYRLVAVTNQGGIAMGFCTHEQAAEALYETNRQTGGLFDLMLMCRHHPYAKDPLMANCLCRKPKYGMIVMAQDELSRRFAGIFPPCAAVMVGDRPEDRACAEGAGIKFIDAAEWRAGSTIEMTVY